MFTFYILYTCVECGNDMMSYFTITSSYLNTFLVLAFTISQKYNNIFTSIICVTYNQHEKIVVL